MMTLQQSQTDFGQWDVAYFELKSLINTVVLVSRLKPACCLKSEAKK